MSCRRDGASLARRYFVVSDAAKVESTTIRGDRLVDAPGFNCQVVESCGAGGGGAVTVV
jgi:hypothetical protein